MLVCSVLQICWAEAGFASVCRIHEWNFQLRAQPCVLPICISAVCQTGFGGIKKETSSFLWEEQQVPSVKNSSQAAARAQASEAGPNPWAGPWCLLLVSLVASGEWGSGIGVSAHSQSSAAGIWWLRQSQEGLSPISSSEPLLSGTFRWIGPVTPGGMPSRRPSDSSLSKNKKQAM